MRTVKVSLAQVATLHEVVYAESCLSSSYRACI